MIGLTEARDAGQQLLAGGLRPASELLRQPPRSSRTPDADFGHSVVSVEM